MTCTNKSLVASGLSFCILTLTVFTALALLCSFGITESALGKSRIDSFSTGYEWNQVYSDRNGTEWTQGDAFTRIKFSGKFSVINWKFGLSHSEPSGDLRQEPNQSSVRSGGISGDEANGTLAGAIIIEERQSRAKIDLGILDNSLGMSIRWGIKPSGRVDKSFQFSIQPSEKFKAAVSRGVEHPLPSYSIIRYEYLSSGGVSQFEGGRFDWQAPAWRTRLWLSYSPIDPFSVEMVASEIDFKPEVPVPQSEVNGTFTGVLDGLWRDDSWRIKYLHKSGWTQIVSFRRIQLNARLRFYDSGYRFGHFGIVELDASQWSLQFERRHTFIKYCYGSGEGELRGTVEAWPFVRGLLQFLGERRHFVSQADLKWHYVALGKQILQRGSFYVNGGVIILDLQLDARQVNWRPYFGFGVNDLRADRLDIKRADLARLMVAPTYERERMRVTLTISQWAPLLIGRYKNESVPDGNGTESTKDGGTIWGGFSAGLHLRLMF